MMGGPVQAFPTNPTDDPVGGDPLVPHATPTGIGDQHTVAAHGDNPGLIEATAPANGHFLANEAAIKFVVMMAVIMVAIATMMRLPRGSVRDATGHEHQQSKDGRFHNGFSPRL
jgi:hypothetical protein